MKKLTIYIHEGRADREPVTVRVPLSWMSTLAALLPRLVVDKLAAQDIDIDAIVKQARNAPSGVLCEIEDKPDRIVIAVEDDASENVDRT